MGGKFAMLIMYRS